MHFRRVVTNLAIRRNQILVYVPQECVCRFQAKEQPRRARKRLYIPLHVLFPVRNELCNELLFAACPTKERFGHLFHLRSELNSAPIPDRRSALHASVTSRHPTVNSPQSVLCRPPMHPPTVVRPRILLTASLTLSADHRLRDLPWAIPSGSRPGRVSWGAIPLSGAGLSCCAPSPGLPGLGPGGRRSLSRRSPNDVTYALKVRLTAIASKRQSLTGTAAAAPSRSANSST